MKRPPLTLTATAVIAGIALAAPAAATGEDVTQTAPVNWHAQSGKEGPVGEGADATLVRTTTGIGYEISTTGLVAGNAYTVWFVVVNDPASCTDSPCAAPQFFADPALDAQVTWGLDGQVAADDGSAKFAGEIAAGPLLDGWLAVQGLDDPMSAEIHLVLNDHGPVIADLEEEMLSTYRAGCADTSPFPDIFPSTALDDGTPGPNTCTLYQAAVFTPPVA